MCRAFCFARYTDAVSDLFDWQLLASGDLDAGDDYVGASLESASLEVLHRLVAHGGHRCHQQVVRRLQELADPSSVPILDAAIRGELEVYDYTCSEDGVIAKWFSWALFDIGSDEAFAALENLAKHPNEEVAAEMRYRLSKRR